jgi:hypothetical protein
MKKAILGLALVLVLSVGHAWAEDPALVAFPKAWEAPVGGPADLSSLENDFAVVTLSALDDQPLARSRRLLLTAGASVANAGVVAVAR